MLSQKLLQSSFGANRTLKNIIRHSTVPSLNSLEDTYYRTSENNPSNHGVNHIGRIYTVDPEIPKLFGKELNHRDTYNANNYFGPRKWFDRWVGNVFDIDEHEQSTHCRCNVMRETGIMVREPAVQIINCVKAMDLERPAVRFVLYSTVQYSTVQNSAVQYRWCTGSCCTGGPDAASPSRSPTSRTSATARALSP